MSDPRAHNCRQYVLDERGKIVGVELHYHERPDSPYRLDSVRLVDEYEAAGRTVANVMVLGADQRPVHTQVTLAWPYNGDLTFEHSALQEHFPERGYAEHVVGSAYTPPAVGPLALWCGTGMQSDVIAGLGAPLGHHVSYELVFRLRSASPPLPPEPAPPPLDKQAAIRHIQAARRALGELERIVLGGAG